MVKKSIMMSVSFHVEASKLGLFTSLLENEVSSLKIEHVGSITPIVVKGVRIDKGRPRHSPAAEVAGKLIKELGKGGHISSSENGNLGKALVAAGMSASSGSPICSRLRRDGIVKMIKPSLYEII